MIKNRLKDIRHELKIDFQSEMAELLNLRQDQYCRYENQKPQPTLEIALKIAKKLGKPVEDIFYIEDGDNG